MISLIVWLCVAAIVFFSVLHLINSLPTNDIKGILVAVVLIISFVSLGIVAETFLHPKETPCQLP